MNDFLPSSYTLKEHLKLVCKLAAFLLMWTKCYLDMLSSQLIYIECLTNHHFLSGSLADQMDGLRSFAVWKVFDKERCVSGHSA